MIDLLDAARELQDFCDNKLWQSCFIGGIAVQRWGQPRVTRDVDLTLLTGFGREPEFVTALVSHYRARIADAAEFALRSRVLLLISSNGLPLDISLGALPFEQQAVGRASLFSFGPGRELRTCSARTSSS